MTKPKFLGGMGFRAIELFNLALLARQAWRILQNPNTLSARILKVVYYPDSDVLHAELGSKPSRVWRAISEGRDVLAVLPKGSFDALAQGWIQTHGMIIGYPE